MPGLIRSFSVLLIAIFVAVTLAVAAAPFKAEAAVPMAGMTMVTGGQACPKCDPKMDMLASCTLTCALSTAGVLGGHAALASAPVACSFEMADTAAEGLAPPPPFTPPRTSILA